MAAPVERAKVLLQVNRDSYSVYQFILTSHSRFKDKAERQNITVCSTSSEDYTRKVVSEAYLGELVPRWPEMDPDLRRESIPISILELCGLNISIQLLRRI